MDQRIQLLIANTYHPPLSFFPFIHSGICSPLSSDLLKDVLLTQKEIHLSYILRLAQPNDLPTLYHLLRSYGNREENYSDLEIFPENRLDLIVRNIAYCTLHRWFLTFLLFDQQNPVAFFQIDFYQRYIITEIYKTRLLPFWQPCFYKPLDLNYLSELTPANCYTFLHKNFNIKAYQALYACVLSLPNPQLWLNFICGGLQTYRYLNTHLNDIQWVGNISYNLMPNYQHQGIMTEILNYIQFLVIEAQCYALFSDRIAAKNLASISLLTRNKFKCTGEYEAYFGPIYQTRQHPHGNFSEPCVCFYKELC